MCLDRRDVMMQVTGNRPTDQVYIAVEVSMV